MDDIKKDKVFFKKIIICLFVLYPLIAVLLGANITGGAKKDFLHFHFPSVQQFISNDFIAATRDLNSASGPFFYYLMSFVETTVAVRIVSVLIFLWAAFLLWTGTKNLGEDSNKISWLPLAYLVSACNISNSTWALPENFALFLIVLAWRVKIASPKLESVFLALSVFTRQTMIVPTLCRYGKQVIEQKDVKPIVHLAPSILAGIFLVYMWGGLTPPKFSHHSHFSLRVLFVSYACFAFFLLPASILNYKDHKATYRKSFPFFMALLLVLLYVWRNSAPIHSGGFVFSRLDSLSSYASPVLISLICFITVPLVIKYKALGLSFLVASVGFSMSNIFYFKYVDGMFFALALTAMSNREISTFPFKSVFIAEIAFTVLSLVSQKVHLNVQDAVWVSQLVQ